MASSFSHPQFDKKSTLTRSRLEAQAI